MVSHRPYGNFLRTSATPSLLKNIYFFGSVYSLRKKKMRAGEQVLFYFLNYVPSGPTIS